MTSFVAIEGLDASGKTTQVALLETALRRRGITVETWSFPRYDSFFGQQIHTLLAGTKDTTAANLDPASMALWFAADRWDAVHHHRMQAGSATRPDVILLNRWVLSNAVYQGGRAATEPEQNALFDWVLDLEYGRFLLPHPILNIVLEVSVETSMARAKHRAATNDSTPDVYESSARLLNDSRRLYGRAAERIAEVRLIDVDQKPLEAVHDIIMSMVVEALPISTGS